MIDSKELSQLRVEFYAVRKQLNQSQNQVKGLMVEVTSLKEKLKEKLREAAIERREAILIAGDLAMIVELLERELNGTLQ